MCGPEMYRTNTISRQENENLLGYNTNTKRYWLVKTFLKVKKTKKISKKKEIDLKQIQLFMISVLVRQWCLILHILII